MPVARKVLSFSSETWIRCAWFECEREGYELYKSVFHEHASTLACDNPVSSHVHFIFCTERHRQFFRNSHLNFGQLPAGHHYKVR
jgi:hypothetical protein